MTTLKIISFISGIALTISMSFIWPVYYLIVLVYLMARFSIAIVKKEKNWTTGAVLFTLLTGPCSGFIEIIEWYEINKYINWIKEIE